MLEDPGHSAEEQPYFFIGLKNISKGTTLYEKFAFSGQPGVNWQSTKPGVLFTDWQIVDIPLEAGQWSDGDTIQLKVIAAGCSASGHYGYVYVDAFGAFLPGMTVTASAPASIRKGQDLTYTYNWANTGGTTVNNVFLKSVAPENTTFVSADPGCSASGDTVTCSLGNKSPGASGSVQITYKVSSTASGSINHGNYQIYGDGFAALTGPLVTTTVLPDTPPTGFTGGIPADGQYGVLYSHDFNADGDPAPTYQVTNGMIPAGLSLNTSTGVLSGRPSQAGWYTLLLTATNSAGSVSQWYFINIHKADTSTSVTRSVSVPVYGEPLTLTATVAPISPAYFTPAGAVQFYVDGAAFGAPVTLVNGTAVSQATTNLDVGEPHTYTAVYLGDSNNNGSSSSTGSVSIAKNSTTTSVVSSSPTSVYGQPVSLTATVKEVSPSVVTPVGQVQFLVDGMPLGEPVALNAQGIATTPDLHTLLPGGHLQVGDHTFSAAYLGNSNTHPSATLESTQTVNQAPTTVSVSSSENPTVYGTSLEMTISAVASAPSIAIPAGEVRLSIDGVPYGDPLTLDENGQARRMVPYLNLWPGNHTIRMEYTPETPEQFTGSNNHLSPLVQVVNKASPIFTITPSVETPVASEPVSYHVVVGPSMPTQGTPSGTVQFIVDGQALGDPVQLDTQGQADSPLSIKLAEGAHTVSVSYSGDDYFLSVPTSPEISLPVSKASAEARIISIDPAEAVVGQPVTVSAQVDALSPATAAPDGAVLVSNGTDTCSIILDSAGKGSCVLEPTAPGAPDLIATYSGSQNFTGDTSDPFAGPVVSKADASVSITGFLPEAPVTGQPVTIYFAVSPVSPGWGTPAGDVTITDQQGRTCTASVAAGSCQMTFDKAGPVGLSAAYLGDDNFNPAGSAKIAGPVVAKAPTGLALVSSSATSVYGQPAHFTAALSVSAPGAGSPTGQVQFTIDGQNFGEPVELIAGVAESLSVAGLEVGAHTVGATYLGDADFAGVSAPAIDQEVNKAGTTIELTSNLNPSPYGMSVLITASLTGNAPSEAIPGSGTVQFIVDGVNYGAPVDLNANGQASKLLPYTALWVGQHEITAVYSGNERFHGSDNLGNPFLQVVEKGVLVIQLEPEIPAPVFGQPVRFTTRIAGGGSNNPVPTGTVQFAVDGASLGTPVALDSAGEALSLAIADLSVGPHTLSLSYNGDDFYRPATITVPSGVVIGKASAALTFDLFTPAAAVVGQPVTFSFDVQVTAPGAGQPSGSVTVNYGGGSCTASVAEGACTLIPTQATGEKSELSLSYTGDENFLPDVLSLQEGPAVLPAFVKVTVEETFSGPVVVGTMEYNPLEWNENSLTVLGWNGSAWSAEGIEIVARDLDANTITFTVSATGPTQFTLAGLHEYRYMLPFVGGRH